jgi:hypothetical protein
MLTLLFVQLFTALLVSGALVTPKPVSAGATGGTAFAYCMWHALDVVPLLDVPKTLNWKLGSQALSGRSCRQSSDYQRQCDAG